MSQFKTPLINWTELIELMSSNVSVKVTDDDVLSGQFRTAFTVNDEKFEFIADTSYSEWEIAFVRLEGGKSGQHQINALGDFDLKSTLAVFSAVKKSMDLWLKAIQAEDDYFIDAYGEDYLEFFFTSKSEEQSRSKLYDKFAGKIAKTMKMKLKKTASGKETVYYFNK